MPVVPHCQKAKIDALLSGMCIQAWAGERLIIATEAQAEKLLSAPGFVGRWRYMDKRQLFEGEIGTFEGMRVLVRDRDAALNAALLSAIEKAREPTAVSDRTCLA